MMLLSFFRGCRLRVLWLVVAGVALAFIGCSRDTANTGPTAGTIAVSFETLQTEYWVASLTAIRDELSRRNLKMIEAVADGDANRQLDQIRNFITQGVDGIIVVPKDAKTIIPAIKAANAASIPLVCLNRPPEDSPHRSTTVVADNYAITRATVEYMVDQARRTGRKHQAMILIGDLGDINAIERRNGFEDVAKEHPDVIEVVARIPTEWNQEKAQAGVVNALQANPGINFIFASSDFLFPSVISALKGAGKYQKIGEEGHVLLGGFDGDALAYQMLVDGYLDADGVQDMAFEAQAAVQTILDARAGKDVPARIEDPGFVIHQGNLQEFAPRMWGAQVKR